MDLFWRIVIGTLIMVVGYLMCAKTQWFLDMLGPVQWAERHFVSEGSRLFYKLLGIAIIMIGMIVVTNLFDRLVGGFIMRIF